MPKVLIIRFSSIGDIVLTTPVLRCIRMQTGAELHFLTKENFRSVVEHNPHVGRVHTIRKKVSEVLPALKAEGYDFVVDLHRNLRSWQVKTALGVPSKSFDKLNWEKWLLVNLGINRLPRLHIVDRYLAAAAPLGVQNDGLGLDYFIPETDEEAAQDFLTAHFGGGVPAFIALVTGAAHATKRLPEARLIELCRLMTMPVVLLGGPDEQEQGERIAAQGGAHVVNACGKLKLNQSAGVLRRAQTVVTHDTGLMHIAAALGKDIVSIWGNTVPEFGMTPYIPGEDASGKILEVKGLSCRPCSKIGHQACPKGHFRCMNDIDFSEIINWRSDTPDRASASTIP
ncbi:MAG TPA: glycosyltransferase family 9 protein [Saprospiraceae bacterium]|nr:glycosyltransferase family 9 protein [Saprospiraceae bacterium]